MQTIGLGEAGAAADARGKLGEFIRSRRIAAGLTQEELAERAELGVRTIRDIEQGRSVRPHRRSLDLLSGALGLAAPALGELARVSLADRGGADHPAPVLAAGNGYSGRHDP